jgi:LPS export ABC transporter protein LptC
MFSKRHIFLFSFFLIFSLACENDIKVINTLSNKNNSPVESAKDVETIYSDSGHVVVIVKAPQLDRYEGDNPYNEMPKGVDVKFYDSTMHVKSKLTANYAISYTRTKIMEAKNNVVVVNAKNETLNTEHLVWDQNKSVIYSDKFVKVNTGKEILYGEGLDADERFDHWVIKKPTGSFTIKDE